MFMYVYISMRMCHCLVPHLYNFVYFPSFSRDAHTHAQKHVHMQHISVRGFVSVCVRVCVWKALRNDFPVHVQTEQEYNFIIVYVFL